MIEKMELDQRSLSRLLSEITEEGGFSYIILTDETGFPIAASSITGDDMEIHAATVSKIQQNLVQTKDHLNLADLEELAINDNTGKKLIIHPFTSGSSILFLALSLPTKAMPYKRLLSKLIRIISRDLSD